MRLAQTPIVQQMRSSGLKQVQGVLEFSAETVEPRQLPAFYVVPVGETAKDNAQDAGRDQAVDVTASVMIAVDGSRRNTDGISDSLKECEDAVCAALVGWTHPAASRPFSYAGGRLASARGSTVVWELRLRTRYHLRKAS